MGFFSGIKSGVDYNKFSHDVIEPAVNAAVRTAGRDAELYELFLFVWKRVLSDHGKEELSGSGGDSVKYFAVMGIKEGGYCLSCALAEILLPGFKEAPQRRKFGEMMSAVFEWERRDDGRAIGKSFLEAFPRSHAAFIKENGYAPFDPQIRRAVESGDPVAMVKALKAKLP